jgi:hypothetical protein
LNAGESFSNRNNKPDAIAGTDDGCAEAISRQRERLCKNQVRGGELFRGPFDCRNDHSVREHLADKRWADQNISNRNLVAEVICFSGIKFAWAVNIEESLL